MEHVARNASLPPKEPEVVETTVGEIDGEACIAVGFMVDLVSDCFSSGLMEIVDRHCVDPATIPRYARKL